MCQNDDVDVDDLMRKRCRAADRSAYTARLAGSAYVEIAVRPAGLLALAAEVEISNLRVAKRPAAVVREQSCHRLALPGRDDEILLQRWARRGIDIVHVLMTSDTFVFVSADPLHTSDAARHCGFFSGLVFCLSAESEASASFASRIARRRAVFARLAALFASRSRIACAASRVRRSFIAAAESGCFVTFEGVGIGLISTNMKVDQEAILLERQRSKNPRLASSRGPLKLCPYIRGMRYDLRARRQAFG